MTAKQAKRGRPVLAAKSKDAAAHAVYTGQAPKRPRNRVEQDAARKHRGRKPDPQSPTQLAAQLAVYLVQADGVSIRAAAQQAAERYGVNTRNVRKYATEVLKGPQTVIKTRVPPMFSLLTRGEQVEISIPLVPPPADVDAAFAGWDLCAVR